jgi:hypothetical protein
VRENLAHGQKQSAFALFRGNGFSGENIAKGLVRGLLGKRDGSVSPGITDWLVMGVAQLQEETAGDGD